MSTKQDITAFESAIANMSMEKSPFFQDYVFYMHLVSQCHININKELQAAAGVSFKRDHYILHLNPNNITSKDKYGKETTILGFNMEMPIEQRIGVLKHEMLHIALNHVGRFKLHVDPEELKEGHYDQKAMKQFMKFNIAADCALDQEINRKHLPSYAIYPDNFPNKKADKHWKESTEFYYELLDDESIEKIMGNSNVSGVAVPGSGEASGKATVGVDDHSTWLESEGDSFLQSEITKRMVERAGAETMKTRGNLPSNYSQIIENLTIRREVCWKQILRRIVGNKKANQRKTLMRKDRRMPNANWIKGKIKARTFTLGVISDVSASVSDEALYELWGEIISICDTFKTSVKMVQVDSQPSEPEELTKASRKIERKHCGGTFLSPAIKMFKDKGITADAYVVTTDGFLHESDLDPFVALKKPVIWLIEEKGKVMDLMNTGQMRAIKLSKNK